MTRRRGPFAIMRKLTPFCLTCASDLHIHVPRSIRNVRKAIANSLVGLLFLPIWLSSYLLGSPIPFLVPCTLDRRCANCGGLFLNGTLYRGVRGVCPRCTYDLTGNVSGTCPECGKQLDPRVLNNARR